MSDVNKTRKTTKPEETAKIPPPTLEQKDLKTKTGAELANTKNKGKSSVVPTQNRPKGKQVRFYWDKTEAVIPSKSKIKKLNCEGKRKEQTRVNEEVFCAGTGPVRI